MTEQIALASPVPPHKCTKCKCVSIHYCANKCGCFECDFPCFELEGFSEKEVEEAMEPRGEHK